MKLLSLKASRYRSLRDETVSLNDLNLFIGTNASGKSTILDALRYLHEGVQDRDFRQPTYSRGGFVHLAWKGEEAQQIELLAQFEEDGKRYEWTIRLTREGSYDFTVQEDVTEFRNGAPPSHLLSAEKGRGWWWSGGKEERVTLAQPATTCSIAAAAVDESFPARGVAEYVSRWGFFDPSPFLLRRGWTGLDSSRFDPYGRNLAEHSSHYSSRRRLHTRKSNPRPSRYWGFQLKSTSANLGSLRNASTSFSRSRVCASPCIRSEHPAERSVCWLS